MISRGFCCCESKILFMNLKFIFKHHVVRTLRLEKWPFLKSDIAMRAEKFCRIVDSSVLRAFGSTLNWQCLNATTRLFAEFHGE
jgi:hypothetical protein